jgi:hypothetical protein
MQALMDNSVLRVVVSGRLLCKMYDSACPSTPMEAIVVVIVWYQYLQLPVQSVPITTKVVSSNPARGEVYSIQHFVIMMVSDLRHVGDFLRVPQFYPPIKHHDIAEILLNVALNTTTLTHCPSGNQNIRPLRFKSHNSYE